MKQSRPPFTASAARPAPGAVPTTPSGRDGSIETLRGLAIVLVVAYHAVADLPSGPSVTADLDVYGYMAESLRFVRMPLFTVISGFVYAMRPVTADRIGSFAVGKARRVLVPYLVATTLLLGLSWSVGRGEVTIEGWNVVGHILVGAQHLWYLPAIMVVFAIVGVIDARGVLGTSGRVAAALVVAISVSFVVALVVPGSVNAWLPIANSAYLLPYFLYGLGCRRFGWHQASTAFMIATTAAVVSLGAQSLSLNGLLDLPLGRHGILATVGGIATATLLLRLGKQQVWIARVGGFSMTIYLFHFYGLSVGKSLSEILSLGTPGMLAMKLIFGVSVPIVLELVLIRFRLGRIALGLRPRKPTPEPSTGASPELLNAI